MHSAANGHGSNAGNGTGGPYSMTIAGVPLNPVPEIWAGMIPRGSLS